MNNKINEENRVDIENKIKLYKEIKDKKLLEEIFVYFRPLIRKKAKYIYERKWYPLSLYHKCKFCRQCIIEDKTECKTCDKCECIKGFFNLRSYNLCDYMDVEQDLILEILRIIENYDISKSFYTYLYSCMFDWTPSFLTKDFIKSITHKPFNKENNEGELEELPILDTKEEDFLENIDMKDFIISCSDLEKKYIRILLKEKGLKKVEIAKRFGISSARISQISKELEKKLKYYLNS